MSRILRPALVCLILGLAGTAKAAPDVERGERIAKRWCAACHVVSPDQKTAKVGVATFADVARRKTAHQIADFLTDPHPKMPDMSLTRDEIADIAAYIKTLAPGPADAPTPPVAPAEPTAPNNG